MSKILIYVVAMLCMITVASAGVIPVTVYTADVDAAAGGTVEVPVHFSGAENIGSMDLLLDYDSAALQATGVSAANLGSNAFIESNVATSGKVTVALADPSGITGDGEVVTVLFTVLGDEGTSTVVSVEKAVLHNVELVEVVTDTEDGTVAITGTASESAGYGGMMMASIGIICLCALFMKRKD